jgi:hypothetical protein
MRFRLLCSISRKDLAWHFKECRNAARPIPDTSLVRLDVAPVPDLATLSKETELCGQTIPACSVPNRKCARLPSFREVA